VIEAYRFDNRISNLPPYWLTKEQDDGTVRVELKPLTMFIKTLEGEMTANEGDWIIKGVKGELYPCKADIFALTYEPVEASA
jgi:hypothetical protein